MKEPTITPIEANVMLDSVRAELNSSSFFSGMLKSNIELNTNDRI